MTMLFLLLQQLTDYEAGSAGAVGAFRGLDND